MPKQSKVTTLSVNFTGVEDRRGGSAAHVAEGDYLLKLDSAEVKKNQNNDGKHVLWVFSIVDGPQKSSGKIYHRTTLKPESLWALRNILSDLLQKDIPKKALNIDFSKYTGKQIGATIEDDEPYENKVKSKIAFTFPASDFEKLSDGEEVEDSDDDEDEEEIQTADITSDEDEDEDEEELETVDADDL